MKRGVVNAFLLKGKKAVVTGAASIKGIGRAIALTLAEAGADVVVADVHLMGNDYDLKGTADAISKIGRRSLALKVDISDEKDVNKLIDKTVDEFGTIDIMVNNAGVGAMMESPEINRAYWDKMMEVNVRGCHFCCLTAGRIMKEKQKGSIINIGSISGIKYTKNQYVYGISKAANRFITTALAKDFLPYNIRVNCIAPGMVETEINAHDLARQVTLDQSGKTGNKMSRGGMFPQGRICQPQDIANVALFLASDASAYVSGQIIVVDGGVSL
jgi:NAD(P)-dependent dehydrogenase (short-subunit alcohol dehydrogenase family)